MHIPRTVRNTLLTAAVSLIVLPAAISEGHERQGHAEKHARHEAEKEAKHGAKGDRSAAYVFKGTFNVADSSVTVLRGNQRVRRAGFVGQHVVFDLSAARIRVADANGDGKRDAADLQDGDKVVVQARLPRHAPGSAPFAARKLVDQSRRHDEARDDEAGDDPAAEDDQQGEQHDD